ncbi:MAG TPA: alpha/beta fold hydrolase [Nitrospiraceae bacterium]|nr:alpha/beta fold hydrolase [Nitrospiraceae bacterium]
MRRDRSLQWRLRLLMVMPVLLTACSTPSDLPRWFDAIHRTPLQSALVAGHRIVYLDAGTGPPVILVHGFGGSLWQWEYQQPLAESHRLITLDLLGSGLSDKPDVAYTPAHMVESFRAFMDAVHIPRASLVGNSMGAGLVLGMALTFPDRVDRIVLIDGFPDHVRDKLTSPLVHRALETSAPLWLVNMGNYFAGRGLTRRVLSEMVYDIDLLTPAVVDRSYRNRKRGGMIGPLLEMATHLQEWEETFAMRLDQIQHRTLVIWGAQDKVFPPHVGRNLSATLPNAGFELIPEAGHIPMWERPDLVNPLLLKFLPPTHGYDIRTPS